jgi:hypothetical protein
MITNPSKPIDVSKYAENVFHVLGKNKTKTQILFLKTTPKNVVTLDVDSVLDYGPNCKCYPVLNALGLVVGSLLAITTNCLTFNNMFLTVITSEEDNFSALQAEGVGGLLSFIDTNDNLLIVPYEPNVNKLTVVDRGQNE